MLIKISTSEQRPDAPQVFQYQNEITITTWGAIKINKVHFFPASFQVKSKEMIVYIDPIEVTAIEKADYIFITHSHPDHLSINDIKVPRDNLTVKDNRKLYRNCHKTIKEHW